MCLESLPAAGGLVGGRVARAAMLTVRARGPAL